MDTTALSKWRQNLLQRPVLLPVAVFLIALLLRLVAIDRYITPDELIWVYRSVNFREALGAGDWAGTLLAGHPGVITMWLGALGTSIQLLINPTDGEVYQWITQLAWLTPDNMAAFQQLSVFLTAGRVAVAVVNSLGLVVIFCLARRLFDDLFAMLAIAFLLLDSFLSGLSGILHVDGLTTTFTAVSLLSLALALTNDMDQKQQRPALLYAALAGATAALAALAKSPALLLAPVTAILFLTSLWRERQQKIAMRLREIVGLGLIWLVSFVAVSFLVFPALWASPLQVLQFTSSNANRHIEEALRPTFFMGEVAFDHGLLFYPIALAWRINPLVLVGLVLVLAQLFNPSWRKRLPNFPILIFILWSAVFLVGISLAAKKFDRYLLPVLPMVTMLATLGWVAWLRSGKRASRLLLGALLMVQLVYVIMILPYPLAGYNLLLGGPYSAQYIMPIGWGESISSAGTWLSGEPGAAAKRAISGIAPSLAPFFAGETLLVAEDNYEGADYIIFTANSYQVDPEGVDQITEGLDLLKKVRYGGLDQAWIYASPHPKYEEISVTALPQPVTFGQEMQLLGQDIRVREDELLFTARWDRQNSKDRFLINLKLLDDNGHVWSKLETELLNEVYFFPENWEVDERPEVTYKLELPAGIAPGDYSLTLSLIDENSGSQLPVLAADGTFEGVTYDTGSVLLSPDNTLVDAKELDMIASDDASWQEGELRLLGYGQLPQRVIAGGELNIDLFWQATNFLPEELLVAFEIGDADPVVLPLSRYDSGLWQPGTIMREKYRLHIPTAVAPDQISITVQPLYVDGGAIPGVPFVLGDVEVQAADYLFALPENIDIPLAATFGPGIHLRGANIGDVAVAPEEVLTFTLFWQTASATEAPVTAFVHLLDDQGEIVAQIDRWPGGLPSNIWVEDQVVVDAYALDLPADLKAGNYELVVGLYTAENGQRLFATDASGQTYPNQAVQLPFVVTVER